MYGGVREGVTGTFLSLSHTQSYIYIPEKERSAMLENICMFQIDNYMIKIVRRNLLM